MLNTISRALAIVVVGPILFTQTVEAQDRSRYRDFALGGDLSSVLVVTKVPASDAKTIHQRPAVIQELEWRPPYFLSRSIASQKDPVQNVVFSFYNDQLFKLVISYDRQRTNGMTDADLTDAISMAYGPPLQPAVKKPRSVSQLDEDSGTTVARWGDADYAVVLYRSSYGSDIRIIVTSPRLEALARTAEVQAIRLDESEAPQREIARLKKEAEDTRASQDKARTTNKAAFRP